MAGAEVAEARTARRARAEVAVWPQAQPEAATAGDAVAVLVQEAAMVMAQEAAVALSELVAAVVVTMAVAMAWAKVEVVVVQVMA